jgi:DNA replication protein DnaC
MMSEILLTRARALKFYGMIEHWAEVCDTPWIRQIIEWEEQARSYRSLERRLTQARLGHFKPLAEFDWSWPKACDREAIEELMELTFLATATNIILCGPNGVGKSTIACNLGHQAALHGHTVFFTTASEMLSDLASCDGDQALKRRFKYYEQPRFLIIDELGYLSYANRHADLLFEIISRRHQGKSTLITTNKSFNEWGSIFPSAACVVSMIDRLIHRSEIILIEAESFRLKEANERTLLQKKQRAERKRAKGFTNSLGDKEKKA